MNSEKKTYTRLIEDSIETTHIPQKGSPTFDEETFHIIQIFELENQINIYTEASRREPLPISTNTAAFEEDMWKMIAKLNAANQVYRAISDKQQETRVKLQKLINKE